MADIQKLAVFDPRIVQDEPAFAVDKGALAITNAPFRAIASTQSQISFNVQIPSLNVFVDRAFEWNASVDFQLSVNVAGIGGAPAPANTPVLVFGRDCAFAPYPLSSLATTVTATINDTATTINLADVLYEVARLTDTHKNNLTKTSPYMLDKYALYNTGAGAINNPISSYYEARYEEVPNGAFQGVIFLNPTNSQPLTGNGTYTSGTTVVSFENGVPVLSNDAGTGNAITDYPIAVRLTCAEPLLLSPFIFSEQCDQDVGMFGVNNIQVIINFGGASRIARVLRNATVGAGANARTISGVGFLGANPWNSATLNVITLTPSLDIPLPPKSVVPYLEYPRFVTTNLPQVTAGATATLRSQTITLPVVPDMLVIYVKPDGGYPAYPADGALPAITSNSQGEWYLPISKISANFDNFAGLLSTHSTTQLYKTSVENGLRMDFNSWSGRGRVVNAKTSVEPGGNVQLVGGFLVLRFGKDIALQSGTAPSCAGQYTLQFDVDITNTFDRTVRPELYVMTVNSGFFETQAGSSRIVRGVLSEQDVISAPIAPEASREKLERMVGGGFFSKVGTALHRAGKMALGALTDPKVRGALKEMAGKSGVPALEKGAKLASMAGLGAVTGGRRGQNARLSALM